MKPRGGRLLAVAVALATALTAFILAVVAGHSDRATAASGTPPEMYLTAGSSGALALPAAGTTLGATSGISGFPAGDTPGAVAVNTTSQLAAIGVSGPPTAVSGGVAVVNAGTHTYLGTISLGTAPASIAMDPASANTAYAVVTGANEGGTIYRLSLNPAGESTAGILPDDQGGDPVVPTAIAMTPGGNTVLVGWYSFDDLVGVFAFTVNGGKLIPSGEWSVETPRDQLTDIAVSPNGNAVYGTYTNQSSASTAFAVSLPLPAAGTSATIWTNIFKTPGIARSITVSPNAQTVYVAGTSANSASAVLALSDASGTQVHGVTVPIDSSGREGGVESIAVAPDGATLYVDGASVNANGASDLLLFSASPTLTLQSEKNLGALQPPTVPESLAITPDQAPVADLAPASGTAGTPLALTAGSSTVAYGTITNYVWNFGDGQTCTTGCGANVSHTYAAAGNYTVTVTETDSAGTSIPPAPNAGGNAVNTAGQTPYLNASNSARISAPVVIVPAGTVPPPPPTTTTTTSPTSPTSPTTQPQKTTSTTKPKTSTTKSTTTTTVKGHKPGTPQLTLSPVVGPPGTIVTVTGTGFPANTPITISWSLSTGSIVVTSNPQGKLAPTQMMILIPDVLGPRFAVASSTPKAKAPFLVVPGTSEPGGDDGSYLFRSEGP